MATEQPVTRPLFTAESALTVRLAAPLSDIMRDRDDEYRKGAFRYIDSSGDWREFDVKVRARGNFRRRKNVCAFAPLRLNFQQKQVRDSVFDGQDKLKLVTHCNSRRSAYEQNILKEYAVYRIFQQLTDLSFRVRLLHVTYVDTNRNDRELTKFAFLIEDNEHLAERMGKPLSNLQRIDPEVLAPSQTNLVTVFQYLIGNTDFSAVLGAADDVCCHNIDLFEDGDGNLLPVPYDFDLSGIINTPYAAPNPKYGIDEVTDRLYRGLCSNNALLGQTVDLFRQTEPAIRRVIDEQVGLNPTQSARMQRYIDRFYDDVASTNAIERNLIEDCS
jgi:hypothetical protein